MLQDWYTQTEHWLFDSWVFPWQQKALRKVEMVAEKHLCSIHVCWFSKLLYFSCRTMATHSSAAVWEHLSIVGWSPLSLMCWCFQISNCCHRPPVDHQFGLPQVLSDSQAKCKLTVCWLLQKYVLIFYKNSISCERNFEWCEVGPDVPWVCFMWNGRKSFKSSRWGCRTVRSSSREEFVMLLAPLQQLLFCKHETWEPDIGISSSFKISVQEHL